MGTWETKLQQVLKYSQDIATGQDKADKHYAKVIAAGNAVSTAHAKTGPIVAKNISAMMDTLEDAGRIAAELSVYEDDLAAAKKAKDKSKVKDISKKMKPLIKSFDDIRVQTKKCQEKNNKEYNALNKLKDALAKAVTS